MNIRSVVGSQTLVSMKLGICEYVAKERADVFWESFELPLILSPFLALPPGGFWGFGCGSFWALESLSWCLAP